MNQLVVVLVMILLLGIIAAIISDKLTTHSRWGLVQIRSLFIHFGCSYLCHTTSFGVSN